MTVWPRLNVVSQWLRACIEWSLMCMLVMKGPFTTITSSNGNIFRVTGLLYGEFTGDRWILLAKASDAELWCFLWSAPCKNSSVNDCDAGDLRRHRAHYDVTVMTIYPPTQYFHFIKISVYFHIHEYKKHSLRKSTTQLYLISLHTPLWFEDKILQCG